MLKRFMVCVAVVLAVFTASSALGMEGAYLGVKGVYSSQEITDPSLSDSEDMWGFSDKSDKVYGFGLAVGYDFSRRFVLPFRMELEYVYRSASEAAWAGDYGIVYEAEFDWELAFENELDTLMVNLFYDFENITPLTPYMSAGVGMAYMNWKSAYSDTLGTMGVSATDDSSEIAWSLGVGCSFDFPGALVLDFGYRYISAGEYEVDYYDALSKGDFLLHEAMLGLRFNF